MHLKMSSGKCWPFCHGLNVLSSQICPWGRKTTTNSALSYVVKFWTVYSLRNKFVNDCTVHRICFPCRLPEERNYDSQEYRYRVNEQYEGRRSTYEDGEQFAERGRLKQRFQTPQAMRAGFSSNRQQQYER